MSRYDISLTMAQKSLQDRRGARFPRIVERLDLIAFDEIADCCACKPGSVERHEELRNQAYRDLKQSILRGEFGPVQKPTIAYLPRVPLADYPGRLTLRLTGGQLIALGDIVIPDLWVPRRLCIRWFKERQIPLPPWLVASSREAEWRSPPDTSTVNETNDERSPARATDRQRPASEAVEQTGYQEPLARATKQEIDDALWVVYLAAVETGAKPPNLKEVVRAVKPELLKINRDATHEKITRCAEDPRFAKMRRRPGKTLRSEIRARGQAIG